MKSVAFGQYEKDIAAGKYGVYVKGWVPDYPDPDNFTAPFFGKGNVLDNNYTNNDHHRHAHPADRRPARPLRHGDDYGELQDIVAEGRPRPPHLAGQAVRRRPRGRLRPGVDCLDASTVFRFWEISKG